MAREYKTRISQAIEAFAAERQDRGFCAADVSVYLDENGIDANTTTVYRNLDRMVIQDKLIKKCWVRLMQSMIDLLNICL